MIEEKRRISVFNGSKEEAMILKILLESFSIQVFEDSSSMSVFNPWGVVGDLSAVKLIVQEGDSQKAQKIINDFNLGIFDKV
ncbi:hypothetical protein [Flavobacterium sp. HBTb2-11-1]|uniref:hypothetical protein n=1 Tax=Flavobacterium sp. HBTb2-11-1 TaxID=2692212 RepID=UPI00136BA769|nr:hypothetical protein [Flavobacterium sp. HBTb2-11-1]MXO03329.1 hypothetical protein [Flavobacterium sp. HBTb2-11-1]